MTHFYVFRDAEFLVYPPIKEHKLAFTPNNAVFKTILDQVSQYLKLGEAEGVANDEELQNIIVDKGLVAGITFHHANVSSYLIKERVLLRQSKFEAYKLTHVIE